MEINKIQKYELVDGHLIVDKNFNVLAANEEMYRFIGISAYEISLLDFIHQVDIDDFMDVCSHINEGKQKDMVLRMRRSDNSYRWMLINISFFTLKSGEDSLEYYEINISDVIALRNQNTSLTNSLLNMRHLLAMDNELFFSYDYTSKRYQINDFVDEKIRNVIDIDIEELEKTMLSENLVSNDTIEDFFAFMNDILTGKPVFNHTFKTNLITRGTEYNEIEFKGNTVYKNNKPFVSVGSIKNISCPFGFYDTVEEFANENETFDTSSSDDEKETSLYDIKNFCKYTIQYSSGSELSFLLIEIDEFNELMALKGSEYMNNVYNIYLSTVKQLIGYRGSVCEIGNGTLCISIRNINTEVYIRAFIECLRDQIKWNIKLMDMKLDISLSIGVARIPQNGNNPDIIFKKLTKALEISHIRGKNKFIIYKEHLHGEIE